MEDVTGEDEGGPSRRALLAALGLGGVGAMAGLTLLDGDGGGQGGTPGDDSGTPTPSGPSIYDIFAELRTAVRASPDHLTERAAAVVEDGDPEAILAFVRDNIVVHPYQHENLERTIERGRWGVRGTLRGGAGTPRDVVDTLAHLYREAGFDPDVVAVRPNYPNEAVEKILFKTPERPFDPSVTEAQAQSWRETVGTSGEPIRALDVDGEESRALAESVLANVSLETVGAEPFEFAWDRFAKQPVVQLTVDGEVRFANPIHPDATLDDPGFSPETRTWELEQSAAVPNVRVSLAASLPSTPSENQELVSGEWAATDLAGRQLLVETLPGVDPFENPGVRFADVRNFLPTLTVQDVHADRETLAELSVQGESVLRSGDRLTVADDGTVERDGKPLLADGDADPTRIETLEATAATARYPEVRLEVTARDTTGEHVQGLPASAFEVVDEEPVGLSVAATQATPRVTFLVDRSGSMPEAYSGESMDRLVETVTDAIKTVQPAADVKLRRTDSNLYTNLAEASTGNANVLVYVSDGDVGDSLTPELEAALRAGPPAVMLNVYRRDQPALREMARVTDGEYVSVSDEQEVLDTVVAYVNETAPSLPTYLLDYAVPTESEAGDQRTATVRVPEAGVETDVTYTVPAVTTPPAQFCGLHLTVEIGGRSVTRTLAGFDPVREEGEPVTQAHIDAVAGALFGQTVLSFEGPAPTRSVWLDDVLTAKLSMREMQTAAASGDVDAALAARDEGFAVVPAELSLLNAPLPNANTADSATYQDTLRVVLSQHRPVFGTDTVERHTDALALTRYRTVAEDPQRAVRLTAERTARIAVVEAALYEHAAASILEERALARYHSVEEAWENEGAEANRRTVDARPNRELALVPTEPTTPFAFWGLDGTTGALTGVLADGSDGGTEVQRIERQLREIDRIMTALNQLVTVAGKVGVVPSPGAAALGVVAQYGQILARLYGQVSIALVTMDASDLEMELQRAMMALACAVQKDMQAYGLASSMSQFLENVFESSGGPRGCPDE